VTTDADHDLERTILGAALLDAGSYWLARAIVGPEHFADAAHAVTWEAMGTVLGAGLPLDVPTLCAELRRRQRLNTIGGAQWLVELTDCIATTAHIDAHARLLRDAHSRRAVARGAEALARRAAQGVALSELQGDARRLLEDATASGASDLVPIGVGAEQERDRLCSTAVEGVVPTGLACLDRALAGGWWQGQLIVIGARPSVGKSALGLLSAVVAALECQRTGEGCVLLVSVEMPARALAARAACAIAYLCDPTAKPIDLMGVRSRRMPDHDLMRYGVALDALDRLPLHVATRRDVTPTQGRALALQLRARYGRVALVVWDYLQKTKPDRQHDSREREVAETAATLAALAGELSCPVMALSQLNRKATDRRPTMADLRESGAIEQDADVVLLLHREGADRSADLVKQRDGAISDAPFPLGWVGPSALFTDPGEDFQPSPQPSYQEPVDDSGAPW
jgi:replicative DNA helicase